MTLILKYLYIKRCVKCPNVWVLFFCSYAFLNEWGHDLKCVYVAVLIVIEMIVSVPHKDTLQ